MAMTLTIEAVETMVAVATMVEVPKHGPLVPEVGTWYLQPATPEEVEGFLRILNTEAFKTTGEALEIIRQVLRETPTAAEGFNTLMEGEPDGFGRILLKFQGTQHYSCRLTF